jgi:hypothetical protein
MADNSVISRSGLASLFGVPGVDFRQQQEEKAAFDRANLTPMQQLSARAIGQGKAAGRELAGLFGAEDPVLKEQSAAKQARVEVQQQGLQPNTPEFWDALTVRLGELGAPNAQAEASNIGMQVKEKTQKIATDRATEQAKLREKIPAVQEQADTIRFNELVQQFGTVEGARRYREEQLTGKKSIAAAGAPPGQKQIFEVEKDRAKKIQKELDSGYTVLERLKEQEAAIKNGVIGGSFADTRTKLATLGAALGIADPRLIESLANTRSFKANENALGAAIAKQLGVNPTDKDFVASLDQFARNSDDPRAALIFIEQLKDKFGKRVKINEDMMNVYLDPETGGSFRNYKGPKMIEPFTKPADELQQLLKEKADRAKKKTKE